MWKWLDFWHKVVFMIVYDSVRMIVYPNEEGVKVKYHLYILLLVSGSGKTGEVLPIGNSVLRGLSGNEWVITICSTDVVQLGFPWWMFWCDVPYVMHYWYFYIILSILSMDLIHSQNIIKEFSPLFIGGICQLLS